MFENLEVMKLARGMASHASARQALVAENIANADTPRYQAKDIQSFAQVVQDGGFDDLKNTRASHLHGSASQWATTTTYALPQNPNGNTVSLETEMVKATELRHQHEMALAIYKSSLNVLRASIGRR